MSQNSPAFEGKQTGTYITSMPSNRTMAQSGQRPIYLLLYAGMGIAFPDQTAHGCVAQYRSHDTSLKAYSVTYLNTLGDSEGTAFIKTTHQADTFS